MFIQLTKKYYLGHIVDMPLETTFFGKFIPNSVILSHAEENDPTFSLCIPGKWTIYLIKTIKQKKALQ